MQKTSFRTLQKNRLAQHKKLKFKQDFIVFKECFNLIKKTKAKNILIFIPLGYGQIYSNLDIFLVKIINFLSHLCKIKV